MNELSDCNGTQTNNHLARKRTLSHLAKLATVEYGFTLKLVCDMIKTYNQIERVESKKLSLFRNGVT